MRLTRPFEFVTVPLCCRRISVLGFALMGYTYGPIGTALAEIFPTAVRYTGASLTFDLGGIVGASRAPFIATWLASTYSLTYVGYYLTAAAPVTIVALLVMGEGGLRKAGVPAGARP